MFFQDKLIIPDCTMLSNRDSAFSTMCMSRSSRALKNSRMLLPRFASISNSSDSVGQILVNIVKPSIASFCINVCCARSILTKCCTAPYLIMDKAICLSLKNYIS